MSRRDGEPNGTPRSRKHRLRTRVLALLWTLAAVGFGLRAGDLQLFEADRWRQVAHAQNAARVEIPAQRGGIYDRGGKPLALESQEFRAYLAPSETPDPDRAVQAIDRVLGLDAREEARLTRARDGWVAIPRRIDTSQRQRLMAAVRRGLHFERLADRVHPQGPMARQLLGRVGAEGEGRSGLELALDSLLRGEPGEALTRRDALGGEYRLPDAELSAPRPGMDVRLTIDAELQRIAESALQEALRETGATGGDVLMLEPSTGEILAVASRRGDGSMRVPAFTDAYEPGSTLKPFLLASLLAEGEARLSERVDTEGGVLRRDGRVIRDVHEADTLSVAGVVQFSSNVGAAKLAERLRPGVQYRYLRDFGFGVPAGIEYPAESGGRLRKPDAWSGFSQASLAMGYEISVTSVQLAAAYGALANGGMLMRPYLIREVRTPQGRVLRSHEPRPVRRVVEPEVARQVTAVLASVVQGGTGRRAHLASLPMAGKTGTARMATASGYAEGRYAASFVGFTPVDDPSLVILAKLNDPQGQYYGGLTAAPISRSTLQAALATRGVTLHRGGPVARTASRLEWGRPADRTAGSGGPYVFAVSGSAASGAGPAGAAGREAGDDGGRRVLPDLEGLPVRTAVARLHRLGLRVELKASGAVRGQHPGPGARLQPGATVVLR